MAAWIRFLPPKGKNIWYGYRTYSKEQLQDEMTSMEGLIKDGQRGVMYEITDKDPHASVVIGDKDGT
jgi:hypothetical protein